MDKKSKILFSAVFIAFFVVAFYKYKEFIIDRNFVVYGHVSCDPTFEACFVSDCDEADPECDKTPYKKIEKLASRIPACDPSEGCAELFCAEAEEGCFVTLCSSETKEAGEFCSELPASDQFGALSDQLEGSVSATSSDFTE